MFSTALNKSHNQRIHRPVACTDQRISDGVVILNRWGKIIHVERQRYDIFVNIHSNCITMNWINCAVKLYSWPLTFRISATIKQWKDYENWSTFAEVIAKKYKLPTLSETRAIIIFSPSVTKMEQSGYQCDQWVMRYPLLGSCKHKTHNKLLPAAIDHRQRSSAALW